MYLKQNKERKKFQICMFTCITVRATHLELVEGMTSEKFLFFVGTEKICGVPMENYKNKKSENFFLGALFRVLVFHF